MLLEHQQAWGPDHFSRDLVPALDHLVSAHTSEELCEILDRSCFE